MTKKVWYTINIECIKDNPSYTLSIGNVETIAKVKSKGLAYIIAENLNKTYNAEYFKISIN